MRDLRRTRRRVWTPEEDKELLRLSAQVHSYRIAQALQRTKLAVEARLARLKRRATDADAE